MDRRLAAVLAVAEGEPLVAVARRARVDRTTGRRWVDAISRRVHVAGQGADWRARTSAKPYR